ncbi:MAG TPA: FkbM family methyltransferase [Sedimentisphaerales bacterium]|nr:FkbM family methyltransferase [Sedimentisphaerales bacterium]
MGNRLSSFIKKKLLGKNKNLVSLDEPYEVMASLLKSHQVTGIIDAGASDGRISKRLLRKFPEARAYAFEPNPFYAEMLKQYAKDDPRFHPQFLALSDHEGTADLYVTESPGCTSLFAPAKRLKEISLQGASVKSLEKVELVTIDKWAERNGDPAIQLMKFDIQGGELKVLHGATRVLQSSTLLVYTEIWFNCPYEGGAIYSEIDLFLREHGFVLYDIFKPKYNAKGLIMWGNGIFLNVRRLGI